MSSDEERALARISALMEETAGGERKYTTEDLLSIQPIVVLLMVTEADPEYLTDDQYDDIAQAFVTLGLESPDATSVQINDAIQRYIVSDKMHRELLTQVLQIFSEELASKSAQSLILTGHEAARALGARVDLRAPHEGEAAPEDSVMSRTLAQLMGSNFRV